MTPFFLAQTKADSNDLSFLRIPQGTPEMWVNTGIVIAAIIGGVIATVIIQRFWQAYIDTRPTKKKAKVKAGPRLEPRQQAALDLLRFYTEPLKLNQLLVDARIFETAVEKALPTASDDDVNDINALRRYLRMTVMNHNMEVVSTRQLLEDLNVRIIASVGDQRVDLYCSLLQVNERFLLIDHPYQEDIYKMLARYPKVHLVYWREESGEALFDITLEPIQQGEIFAFRANHALRSEDSTQRADFRLSVDVPVHYACVTREQLAKHKETGAQVSAIKGEGRLIDLSHGGGALIAPTDLPLQGFAQLSFTLDGQPVRMMLELLAVNPVDGGKHVGRGRFRGASPDSRSRLEIYLSREQINRLRNRETFFTKVAG